MTTFEFSKEIAQNWTLNEFNKLSPEREMNFLNARLIMNQRKDWLDSDLFNLLGQLIITQSTTNALDSLNFQLSK